MNLPILYFDVAHSVKMHDWIIEKSGGLSGVYPEREGKLHRVLEHIQKEDYYPTFEDKLVNFIVGNKRSSLVLGAYFLELYGYDYCVKDFTLKMENIVVWLAESKISKDLLRKLICSILNNEDDYSEALKYELLCAISEEY